MFPIIRKFYDVQAPETPSLASLMAKQGVKADEGSTVEVPNIILENKEQTQTKQPTEPVVTATLETPAEPVKAETPTPSEQPKDEPTKNVETPKETPTWQQVLKQQQPDAILKELGYDEKVVNLAKKIAADQKMSGFYSHWENNGNVKDYLDALSVDFKAMPPEEVMKHQLRKANPDMDESEFNDLYKMKVIDRYKLDADTYTADEIRLGRIELKADSRPVRDELAKNQEGFLLSQPPAKEPQVDVLAEMQRKEAEFLKEVKTVINNDPAYRDILTNKRIQIGVGDEAMNYPISDPEQTIGILYDTKELASHLFDENGNPHIFKQILMAEIAKSKDGTDFIKALAKHYKSLGGKAAIEPIENPKKPDAATSLAPVVYKNMAEAMGKAGRLVSGGGD